MSNDKLRYVDITTKGCEGWLNLIIGDHCIAMVKPPVADMVRKALSQQPETAPLSYYDWLTGVREEDRAEFGHVVKRPQKALQDLYRSYLEDCSKPQASSQQPESATSYTYPSEPRPVEPCNAGKNPEQWAAIAEWEAQRGDHFEEETKKLERDLRVAKGFVDLQPESEPLAFRWRRHARDKWKFEEWVGASHDEVRMIREEGWEVDIFQRPQPSAPLQAATDTDSRSNCDRECGAYGTYCRCNDERAGGGATERGSQVPEGWRDRILQDYQQEYMGQSIPDWISGLPDSVIAPSIPEKREWISCEERLPADQDLDCEGQIWGLNKSGWSLWKWRQVGYAYQEWGITHWMPTGLRRPEPPEVQS